MRTDSNSVLLATMLNLGSVGHVRNDKALDLLLYASVLHFLESVEPGPYICTLCRNVLALNPDSHQSAGARKGENILFFKLYPEVRPNSWPEKACGEDYVVFVSVFTTILFMAYNIPGLEN
jgi:hypothetical protein